MKNHLPPLSVTDEELINLAKDLREGILHDGRLCHDQLAAPRLSVRAVQDRGTVHRRRFRRLEPPLAGVAQRARA